MGAKGRNFYHDLVSRYGYEAEADRIQELYLAGKQGRGRRRGAGRAAGADQPDRARGLRADRVQAFREAGVTMLNVTPVGPDPRGAIATLKQLVQ